MSEQPAPDGGVESRLTRPNSISFLQIPADDAERAAAFYSAVFGWNIRRNGDHVSFDDATGYLSGAWETGRAISREPGLLPYVYVTDVDEAVARITTNGGAIVRPPYAEGSLRVATFRDPAGNVLGIWQAT